MSNCAKLKLKIAVVGFLICCLAITEVVSRCSERNIDWTDLNPAAEECVTDSGFNARNRWQKGDAFSFGNLDDFCLAAGVSDTPALASNKTYTGVGSVSFPILDRLVKGSAWSYNSDSRLQVANIDWLELIASYNVEFQRKVGVFRDLIAEREERIRILNETFNKYTETTWFTTKVENGTIVPDQNITKRPYDEAVSGLSTRMGQEAGHCCYGQDPRTCQATSLCGHYQRQTMLARRRLEQYQAGIDAGSPTALMKLQVDIDAWNLTATTNEEKLSPYQDLLKKLGWTKDETPDFEAPNPYFIETSAIRVDGGILKNYLHFRVFLNRSVSDTLSRLHSARERRDNARGRIVALVMMVKDQDGWPIGDFAHNIPCKKTCAEYGKSVYSHHDLNDVPCSYTPPTATTHPGMFIFPKQGEETAEGHQEVHATWSFSQDSCNFVTELHVETLVLEDFKMRPGHDSFIGLDTDKLPADPAPRHHLYGWTAQYDLLHPTVQSLGAPDFVSITRMKDRDRRGANIDCHVPLSDGYGFVKGIAPNTRAQIPSKAGYFLTLQAEFPPAAFPALQYYGQHLKGQRKCRDLIPQIRTPAKEAFERFFNLPTLEQYLETPGIVCPCPALPTTPSPEEQTADPSRLHGRLLHGSHMAMAWMVLVPLSWFVARYYKETFSSVFCLQEYWWWMWHVCLILTAAAFGCGGFLSVYSRPTHIRLGRSAALEWHNALGFISFILFYIQIVTGFFRAKDPKRRKIGILVHFLTGLLNQISAIAGVLVVGFVKQSGMSCDTMWATGGLTLFTIIMFSVMEIHVHLMDNKLKFIPLRSYLPPPVKRLFGRDAPGRVFRILMLGIFITGLLTFYFLIITMIWNSNGVSCVDETGDGEGSVQEADNESVPEVYDDNDPDGF